MTKRILDIVDMQNDFMMPDGALYVPKAEKIIPLAKSFLGSLGQHMFDFVLMKSDTHFPETYGKNPESQQFPNHCMFSTWGWKAAVPLPACFPIPVYKMNKNVFDMWARQPQIKNVKFQDDEAAHAYKNLFNIVSCKGQSTPRDSFLHDKNVGPDTEVVVMGVASDYCVHDAIAGYLKKGCKVTVLRDMVCGIGTDVPGRAKSGHIDEVLKLDAFREYVQSGQLRTITSSALMREIKKDKKNAECKNSRRPAQPNRR